VHGSETSNIERLKVMTIKFTKDKETKTKVRYTATGDVSGSIYVDKDSELAKDLEIILEISQVTS
jgi:DNA-directed RNA polymerase|tara:strand:- start:28 stop:222 length:195 start_codon:yes stop_codon:yes gene_type:complete